MPYKHQTTDTLGHAALTFFAAMILCLLFESPIHGIEKILLRRGEWKGRKGKIWNRELLLTQELLYF